MKAQSGIEYLITYGWMLVGVSVVSAGLFAFQDGTCNVETDISHPEFRLTDSAVTSDNSLEFAFRSASNDRINITSVQIGTNDSITQTQQITLEPGETRTYEVAETEEASGCAEMDVRVNYDIGVVSDQYVTGTIQLPVNLVQAVVEYLNAGGGEIRELDIQASVTPRNSDICIGDNCGGTVTEIEGEYVSRSGDTLQGPLLVRELKFDCIGDNCPQGPQNLDGNVTNVNNTMDGNLQLRNIKPIDQNTDIE